LVPLALPPPLVLAGMSPLALLLALLVLGGAVAGFRRGDIVQTVGFDSKLSATVDPSDANIPLSTSATLFPARSNVASHSGKTFRCIATSKLPPSCNVRKFRRW
jgi:hypothetical protein